MRQYCHKSLHTITIICVLTYAFLFNTTAVFADESVPPVSTEEGLPPADAPEQETQSTDDASQVPAEEPVNLSESGKQVPVAEELAETIEETALDAPDEPVEPANQTPDAESETADELASAPSEEAAPLDQLSPETQVVVLVDGQVEPLATQAAADAIANTDPVWCPGTAKPGDAGCTPSYTTMSDLLSNEGAYINSQNAGGTIWITEGAVGDTSTITINGSVYTNWRNYELTLQGGWDGSTNQLGTLTGNQSIFSVPIRILNWENTVTINDLSVTNTTTHGINVSTSGDIHLDNVTSSKNTNGHGAVLNNSAGTDRNIKVTNSNFNENNRSGLIATSNGNITLQDVIANENGESGAILNNNGGSGTITLQGTNTFNGNITANGLRAASNNDIISETSLTASGNGDYGAFFNTLCSSTICGAGNVTLNGINTFSNNKTSSGLYIRAGGAISLENVTANDNQDNGAYLNNRGGGGGITLNGTHVFNHNKTNGLAAYSDGDITLNNVIAGTDASTGNGSYGALLNNSTGPGNVVLSGTNIFNNNTLDGLRVVSTRNITINGSLTANNNSRYGAFLSNNTGAGNVVFTGTGSFNANTLDGLRVSSAGNIISTNSLSAKGNNRHGVYLDNTAGIGYIGLSGTNIFNGNKRDGLRIASNGDVKTENTTANTNGQHGFNIETTNGQTHLWCGYAQDNGWYGVNVTLNRMLYLFGMNLSGNTLGPVFVDGGGVQYGDCCLEACKTKPCGEKGINIVSVANTRGSVALNCQLFAGTKLILPNGDYVFIPCPTSGEAASLKALAETDLPGGLPAGSVYGSGFTLDVMGEDQSTGQVGNGMTVSFMIPAGMSADTLSILFWDGNEWIEVDGASQVGNRLDVQVDYSGSFVLVSG